KVSRRRDRGRPDRSGQPADDGGYFRLIRWLVVFAERVGRFAKYDTGGVVSGNPVRGVLCGGAVGRGQFRAELQGAASLRFAPHAYLACSGSAGFAARFATRLWDSLSAAAQHRAAGPRSAFGL